MTIMVGFPPGGGNDTWARLVSRHYGKFLPGNPTIIVENVPGAGGVIMANRLHESRPDGLTIGIHDRGISAVQLQGEEGVRYDVTKWTWLGSLTVEQYFYVVHQRVGVTPANLDLLKTKEVKTANVSPGGFSHLMEIALKFGLDWKLTPIFGYQGNRETVLSIDRGETDGVAISWSSLLTQKQDDLASKVMVPLVQMGGVSPDPLAAGVPTAAELLKDATPQAKQLLQFVETPLNWSRSMSTPPNLEPRVAAGMRAAFEQMMADREFLADAAQLKFEIIPIPGERVQSMMGEFMKTSPETIKFVEAQVKKDAPN
ncbi:MAG: Bug family tripartite tricarboxylate transporter substrate binding protein [Chloroflexota bacterium]